MFGNRNKIKEAFNTLIAKYSITGYIKKVKKIHRVMPWPKDIIF